VEFRQRREVCGVNTTRMSRVSSTRMTPGCGPIGYRRIQENLNHERPERGCAMCVFEHMSDRTPERVLRMRALAAELRTHATETTLESFQLRFEAVATELEQRANIEDYFPLLDFPTPRSSDLRSPDPRFPDKGNGRGYGH
jgi:hypothetical protein